MKNKFKKFGKNIDIGEGFQTSGENAISIGSNITIGRFCWIQTVSEYNQASFNPSLQIGNGTYIGNFTVISGNLKIQIGKNNLISDRVFITDHNHLYEDISISPKNQSISKGSEVIIKDDCWIGMGASILKNVVIGEHCVIGNNTVVTKSIPNYCVVVGNPAKIIKRYSFRLKKWLKYNMLIKFLFYLKIL